MRNDLLFLFAMVQGVGAAFAILAFFGLTWKRIREKISGKGQAEMFDNSAPPRRGLGLALALIIGSIMFSGLGWYKTLHAGTLGNCKTVLTGWGVSGNKIFAAIDTDVLSEYQKTQRLMFISRPADHTIDGKEDKGIVKSGSFGIWGGPLQIEATTNDEYTKRALQAGGWVEFHIVMVPMNTEPDKISSLQDVDRFGGRDLETRGFMLPVTLVPAGQKPPAGAY
jgi:hypothetical protein